ncbi:MAG: S8 family serine peptidase [Planctomycetes bacterium]|nr:S8 family serine peptidase [Planctomycetota bacterium]
MNRTFVLLVCVLCLSSTTGSPQVPGADPAVILVPGTDTRIELGDGFARLSRDRGETWQSLAPPDTRLRLRHGTFDPRVTIPVVPELLRANRNSRLHLVQFHTQLIAEYRAGLRDLGADLHHFLPFQTVVARMSADTALAVARQPYVRWVGDLHPAYKLEEQLIEELLGIPPLAVRCYNVVMVDWAGDRPVLCRQLEDLGGRIVQRQEGSLLVQAELTGPQLLATAALDTVAWIDRTTEIQFFVDNARIQGGADFLEPKKSLQYTGKGIRGYNTEGIYPHAEFNATAYRSDPIRHRSTSTSSHGSSVNGILFARGDRADARGLLPDAQCIAASSSAVAANRDLVTKEAVDPALPYKAMIMTASWGESPTTLYTSHSAEMDDILFKYDIAHTHAQANEGSKAVPRKSTPRAWSKNMISVGGFRHQNTATPNDDAWAGAGSIGPAPDGRIKPDISAYYESILTTYGSTSYTTSFGGTSGATPIVCGHVGLIVEMFTDGLFGHPLQPGSSWQNRFDNRPHMTTTKALLINTARQYPFTGLTHDMTRVHQGYGFPSVEDLYGLRDKVLAIDETEILTNRQGITYLHFVPAGEPQLRATMVYADPAGLPSAAIQRVNDLNLRVTAPDGTVYWGNNGLMTGNYSTPGGTANGLDTVENVFVKDPAPGLWTVTVTAAELNQDGHVETPAVDTDFALVVSGIGGGRDSSGSTLALTSSAPGDLTVAVANLPATYAEGWVLFSVDTRRPVGFGTLLGLAPDLVTISGFLQPPVAGRPYHFPNHKAQSFPNTPYAFPPALVTLLKGLAVDGVAAYLDTQRALVGASNTARVMVK